MRTLLTLSTTLVLVSLALLLNTGTGQTAGAPAAPPLLPLSSVAGSATWNIANFAVSSMQVAAGNCTPVLSPVVAASYAGATITAANLATAQPQIALVR